MLSDPYSLLAVVQHQHPYALHEALCFRHLPELAFHVAEGLSIVFSSLFMSQVLDGANSIFGGLSMSQIWLLAPGRGRTVVETEQ